MSLRTTGSGDLESIFSVHQQAFGGAEEARLAMELLADPSARPVVSILAEEGDRPVGHVLFTRVRIQPADAVSAAILAPLAVVPDRQGRGIGGELVEAGLDELAERGVALAFVLGHLGYYPRFGFEPACVHGLQAPYPIPEEHAGAWMVRALREDILGAVHGRVACADTLDQEKYWVD